jgi:hypothetical protein
VKPPTDVKIAAIVVYKAMIVGCSARREVAPLDRAELPADIAELASCYGSP